MEHQQINLHDKHAKLANLLLYQSQDETSKDSKE